MSTSTSDAWDWSVDAVVEHFCSADGFLFPRFDGAVNRIELENSIRSNYLAGEFLLQLNHAEIEKYLGISTAGPLISCRNHVEQLQRQSHKWLLHISQKSIPQHHPHSRHSPNQESQARTGPEISLNAAPTAKPNSPSHTDTARSVESAESRRVAPLLLSNQPYRETSVQEARDRQLVVSRHDTNNPSVISTRPNILQLTPKRKKAHASDWRELYDTAQPPLIPQESFFQRELPVTSNNRSTNQLLQIGQGQANPEKDQTEYSSSNTDDVRRLEQVIISQLARWKASKLPKLEGKAYQLWTDAWDKTLMQGYCNQQIEQLGKRLQKLKKEILLSVSSRDINRMGEILEPTVTDIAAWEWKSSLYRRPRQPDKPPSKSLQKATNKQTSTRREDSDDEIDLSSEDWDEDEDEEYESYDSDSDEDSDSDDDFFQVVDPSQSTLVNKNHFTKPPTRTIVSTKQSKHGIANQAAQNHQSQTTSQTISQTTSQNTSQATSQTTSQTISPIDTGSGSSGRTESSNDEEIVQSDDDQIADYWDLDQWNQTDSSAAELLMKHKKIEHLLGWNIAHNPAGWRVVSTWLSKHDDSDHAWVNLSYALRFMLRPDCTDALIFKDISKADFDPMMQTAIWYTSWCCSKIIDANGLSRHSIASTLSNSKTPVGRVNFTRFWKTIHDIHAHQDTS